MDSRYRILTLGILWTQSMPSREVNAATSLAEASWRRDKVQKSYCYTPSVGVSVRIHIQNVRANVKVLEFQSFCIFVVAFKLCLSY